MSETIISPGVVLNENDQTFGTTLPIEVGAAIIGPTVKGQVEIPTVCTTYQDYVNKFGTTFISGSQQYTYFTSISAYNYFENGGTSLLVTRVTSGSFTPATSSFISGSDPLQGSVFTLETISEGEIMNSDSAELSDGSLQLGTADNLRWEIISPNTSSGAFTLLIRRGNDDNISPVVLETFPNVTLDPFSPNYIEKVIGNQKQTLNTSTSDYYLELEGSYPNNSQYVRVKEVNLKTPNYLDNAGNPVSAYTSSIPVIGSGSFGGAVGSLIPFTTGQYYQNISSTNTQGLTGSDYDDVIQLLSNKDEYQFKYITAPGLYRTDYASQITALATMCRERGDALAILDLSPYNSLVSQVTSQAVGINNSYAATYWPWIRTQDPNSGEIVWVPASTMVPGVFAFNDSVAEPWFAPAGNERGVISTATNAERILPQGVRDTLYASNVNPIATFPGTGVVVMGQKTLQKKKSALDRVNVRRLLIELKSFIGQAANNLVFQQNTQATRNEFLSIVNPYLSSVQQREGLNEFKVIMDDTNNPPNIVDQNKLVGQVFIQPTRTIEFIQIDFNVTPTGVTFE
jgi:hypothetical protein